MSSFLGVLKNGVLSCSLVGVNGIGIAGTGTGSGTGISTTSSSAISTTSSSATSTTGNGAFDFARGFFFGFVAHPKSAFFFFAADFPMTTVFLVRSQLNGFFYIGVSGPGAAALWARPPQIPPMGAPPAAVKPPVPGGRTNFNPPI